MENLNQGDIIRIEGISQPIIVVSKNYFNQFGEIFGCPIYNKGKESALHISIKCDELSGIVHCEKLTHFDMNVRGYLVLGSISMYDIINITDAIQGIFDYI